MNKIFICTIGGCGGGGGVGSCFESTEGFESAVIGMESDDEFWSTECYRIGMIDKSMLKRTCCIRA